MRWQTRHGSFLAIFRLALKSVDERPGREARQTGRSADLATQQEVIIALVPGAYSL
jgi:hypothetical protein